MPRRHPPRSTKCADPASLPLRQNDRVVPHASEKVLGPWCPPIDPARTQPGPSPAIRLTLNGSVQGSVHPTLALRFWQIQGGRARWIMAKQPTAIAPADHRVESAQTDVRRT